MRNLGLTRSMLVATAATLLMPATEAWAQAPAGAMFEAAVPPGANFDKAEFRLWVPPAVRTLRAVVVLVPGSNGDGRAMAADTVWQQFAVRHQVALVACRFTDKPHDLPFIEEYVDVSHGSGQALLDAIGDFAGRSKHPELNGAPLMLWGMSAGGQFNYEFVAWKPERVIAFVVNKGGIYYSALLPRASREVPGLLFIGEKDLAFRTNTIAGLFAVNRRAGALWALTEEPGAAHVVGHSRELGALFFEDVLALRLGEGAAALTPLAERAGFIGDLGAHTFQPMGEGRAPAVPTAWLPTERVAKAWQVVVSEKPNTP